MTCWSGHTERVKEACPQVRKVVYDLTPGHSSPDIEWQARRVSRCLGE